MPLGTARVRLDVAAVEELLNSVDGPVGRYIQELSSELADIARSKVRVRDGSTKDRRKRAGRGSSASPPGFLKADIRTHLARGSRTGGLYGGVNAAANPGLFLEHPASQMSQQYPFLTTALDALVGRF